MIKYSNTITNTRGDSLPNYRLQVVDADGATVTIYADKSGTRFTDSSGNTINYATADSVTGKAQFYWTPATGQVLQVLDLSGELVDATADFADRYVLANLPGEIAQSAVTALTTDLAARYTKTETDTLLEPKAVIQQRAMIDYRTTTSVWAYVPERLVMAGFWDRSYRKPNGKQFATGADGRVAVTHPTDLAFGTSIRANNWNAVFAVANDEDATCTFVLVPYFTVASVAGNVVTFGQGGTGEDTSIAATYTGLATDELAGCEVFLLEENYLFSRRVVNATANTDGSLTLDDVGTLAQGDRILVKPPHYEHYCWLGDWYGEALGEPRNMADTGGKVGSDFASNFTSMPASGEVAVAVEIDCRGYCSPLARGVTIYRAVTLSTATTGNFTDSFLHDSSNHTIVSTYHEKVVSGNKTIANSAMDLEFSKKQSFWYLTGGTLDTSAVSRTARVRGWFL
jgi:hypothetical protein